MVSFRVTKLPNLDPSWAASSWMRPNLWASSAAGFSAATDLRHNAPCVQPLVTILPRFLASAWIKARHWYHSAPRIRFWYLQISIFLTKNIMHLHTLLRHQAKQRGISICLFTKVGKRLLSCWALSTVVLTLTYESADGSLAREYVRDRHFRSSWDVFNDAITQSYGTNDFARTGFWWLKPEIIVRTYPFFSC